MSKIKWKYILFITPFLFILIGYRILMPTITENLELLDEILSLSNEKESVESLSLKIKEYQAENKRLEATIGNLSNDFPRKENLSRIYRIIGNISEKYHVLLLKIIPQPMESDSLGYFLTIDLSLNGDYKNVLGFLHHIESNSQNFRITNLKFEKSEKKLPHDLTGTLRIIAFLSRTNDEIVKK